MKKSLIYIFIVMLVVAGALAVTASRYKAKENEFIDQTTLDLNPDDFDPKDLDDLDSDTTNDAEIDRELDALEKELDTIPNDFSGDDLSDF